VITSFLRARLVDHYILTIGPILIGGVRGVESLSMMGVFPRLVDYEVEQMGYDLVLWGSIAWD
jgi:riboflavin biosynthesis pyrimidine reductase